MKGVSWRGVPSILPVILAALATAAFSMTATADDAPDEWRPLLEYTLKKNRGEQKFIVGWERSRGLRALRFEVEGSPLEILEVEVQYAKGKRAVWTPERVVSDQEVSQVFELDPELGYVVKLYLEYRLQPEEQSDRYEKKLRSEVTLAGRR